MNDSMVKQSPEFERFLSSFQNSVNDLSDVRYGISDKVKAIKNLSRPKEDSKKGDSPSPIGVVDNCFNILYQLDSVKNDLYDIRDQLSEIV